MGKYSDLFKDTGKYSNLFDYEKEDEQEETEYSGFRAGAIDVLESGLGIGDELDATVR